MDGGALHRFRVWAVRQATHTGTTHEGVAAVLTVERGFVSSLLLSRHGSFSLFHLDEVSRLAGKFALRANYEWAIHSWTVGCRVRDDSR